MTNKTINELKTCVEFLGKVVSEDTLSDKAKIALLLAIADSCHRAADEIMNIETFSKAASGVERLLETQGVFRKVSLICTQDCPVWNPGTQRYEESDASLLKRREAMKSANT